MYVHCRNTKCFWHSDVEPNQCTRGLVIIGEEANCEFDKERNQITAEEFVQTYCHNCGSQRCEGIGTEWFDGCKFKNRLKQ